MPKFLHENLGEVCETVCVLGTITALDGANDTADVDIPDPEMQASGVPIYYHCSHDAQVRSNGALEGSATAFAVDDEVIVRGTKKGEAFTPVHVVAHSDGEVRACGTVLLLFFIQNYEPYVTDLTVPDKEDLYWMYSVLVWDAAANRPAVIDDGAGGQVSFPCQFNEVPDAFWNLYGGWILAQGMITGEWYVSALPGETMADEGQYMTTANMGSSGYWTLDQPTCCDSETTGDYDLSCTGECHRRVYFSGAGFDLLCGVEDPGNSSPLAAYPAGAKDWAGYKNVTVDAGFTTFTREWHSDETRRNPFDPAKWKTFSDDIVIKRVQQNDAITVDGSSSGNISVGNWYPNVAEEAIAFSSSETVYVKRNENDDETVAAFSTSVLTEIVYDTLYHDVELNQLGGCAGTVTAPSYTYDTVTTTSVGYMNSGGQDNINMHADAQAMLFSAWRNPAADGAMTGHYTGGIWASAAYCQDGDGQTKSPALMTRSARLEAELMDLFDHHHERAAWKWSGDYKLPPEDIKILVLGVPE